jgi:hypothetical protein
MLKCTDNCTALKMLNVVDFYVLVKVLFCIDSYVL